MTTNNHPPFQVSKADHVIRSVDDWFLRAPPKRGEKQWKDGRSAKELAKAFFPEPGAPAFPAELLRLLDSHPLIRGFEPEVALPEEGVRLDDLKGETRNTDLLLLGRDAHGPLVVSVEAKADESYGPTIGQRLRAAAKTPRSKAGHRVARLSAAVLGVPDPGKVPHLRYQLLHSSAAAVIAARKRECHRAVSVVFEFHGPTTDPEKVRQNTSDLEAFVRALGWSAPIKTGHLVGPVRLPGDEFVPADVQLFVGKAVREL